MKAWTTFGAQNYPPTKGAFGRRNQQRKVTLIEKLITITGVAPVEVLGANDASLQIRTHFPKLSIIARGDTLKVSGTVEELSRFGRFAQLVEHAVRYSELPRKVLDDIMGSAGPGEREEHVEEADVLVWQCGLACEGPYTQPGGWCRSRGRQRHGLCHRPCCGGKTYPRRWHWPSVR